MSGVITHQKMLSMADKIGDRFAKVSGKSKLIKATKTNNAQNTQTLNRIKATLTQRYGATITDQAFTRLLVTKHDLQPRNLNIDQEIGNLGLTGNDIKFLDARARELGQKLIEAKEAQNPQTVGKLIMNKFEENPPNWPKNLTTNDKALVKREVQKVITAIVQIHGKSADDILGLLAQRTADHASDLRGAAGKRGTIDTGMAGFGNGLIRALKTDGASAAINGDFSLGALSRALAPKVGPSVGNPATAERTQRFEMVAKLATALKKETVPVTINGTQHTPTMQEIFDPATEIWQQLEPADRTKVIQKFMALHAETHDYPNKVELKLDAHKDALNRSKDAPIFGELAETKYTLMLSKITAQTDDPTLIFKTLAHELTHAYQYDMLDNPGRSTAPALIHERLNFDLKNRALVHKNPIVGDFNEQQNLYANDFTERTAIESEWALKEMMKDEPPEVADLVAKAKDLHKGGAGDIRREEWEASLAIQKGLAEKASTPVSAAKNYTNAAKTALELGDTVQANALLNKIDFAGVPKEDVVWLSETVINELSQTLASPRSTGKDIAMALEQLPKFQMALLDNVDASVRVETASHQGQLLSTLVEKTQNPADKMTLFEHKVKLHLTAPNAKPAQQIGDLEKTTNEIFGLLKAGFDRPLYEHAEGLLSELEANAKAAAGKETKFNKQIGRITNKLGQVKKRLE